MDTTIKNIILNKNIDSELYLCNKDNKINIISFIIKLCIRETTYSPLKDDIAFNYIIKILESEEDIDIEKISFMDIKKLDENIYIKTRKYLVIKMNIEIYYKKYNQFFKKFLVNIRYIKFYKNDNEDILKNKLDKIYFYIKSFDDNKFNDSLKMSNIIKINNDMTIKTWENINNYEIEKRFDMLINYYGLRFIRMCGIKILSYYLFKELEFNERVNYYCNSIERIINIIIKIRNDILLYISLKKIHREFLRNIDNKDITYTTESDSDTETSSIDLPEDSIDQVEGRDYSKKYSEKGMKSLKNDVYIDNILEEYIKN